MDWLPGLRQGRRSPEKTATQLVMAKTFLEESGVGDIDPFAFLAYEEAKVTNTRLLLLVGTITVANGLLIAHILI